MKKRLLLSTSLTACSFLLAPLAFANPQDGQVSAGSATIANSTNRVDVHQSTERAVIDWRSFNIDKGETTQFHQPSASSLTVNRINDANPSRILGNLTANGNVVLINRSGISFGKDAVVDVGSLVATTSDMTNADAIAGHLNFQSQGNPNATISNEGTITAREAGLVGLVAPKVENSGVINARLGKVHLASGDRLTVDLYGDGALSVAASDDLQNQLVSNSGTINAAGGTVQLTAAQGAQVVNSLVNVEGEINAPTANEQNGKIIISGNDETAVSLTGTLDVSGATGGQVAVAGKNILQQGKILANGTNGKGGEVSLSFKKSYLDSESSKVEVKGQGGNGGTIAVKGKSGSRAFVSGHYEASSSTGKGGTVRMTAADGDLKLFGAQVNADGATGGGTINIGGEYQGGGDLDHSLTTAVNYSTLLSANAAEEGKGGTITVWSDAETKFAGKATAKGGTLAGDGGAIELSSKDSLKIADNAVTSAAARASGYLAGSLLLDPKNLTIATGGLSGGLSYFDLVDPNADAGDFGDNIYTHVLSNGNVVAIDYLDDFAATDAGAIYLFNGSTGALISTLTGSQVGDQIGASLGSFHALANGNFVISSNIWDDGAVVDAGAVTWGSATTGVSGVVSSANSLVGAYSGETLSSVVTLANGNYLVVDAQYNNGAIVTAGAVAWGNGATGLSGVLSSANALVGTSNNDWLGGSLYTTADGDYILTSGFWDNGGISDAGAITFVDGTVGLSGTISAANSLVGSHANDRLGADQWGNEYVYEFTNGNIVVGSPTWDNGGTSDAGALTFIDKNVGISGAISAANSLIGSTANDMVGNTYSVLELTNGNFVIANTGWDNGAFSDAGAVTMGSTVTGLSGTISAANSLVGGRINDMVGSSGLYALNNGNFVVSSMLWNNGGLIDVGAVTWVDGNVGLTGVVNSSNSLIGTLQYDSIGNNIIPLANGNFVISSTGWNGGMGAATWVNGTTGLTGLINSTNSLVGSTVGDNVGDTISILDSGNYVVLSTNWDDGATADVGAVTWADSSTGLTGVVSSANSLIGSTSGDRIGISGVYSVGTGKMVIGSDFWDNGAVADVGAATFVNEGPLSGVVSTANSLYGTTDSDFVGNRIYVLANGNYLVGSMNWDNGALVDVGALTLADGNTGLTGAVSTANSLYGASANDLIGMNGVRTLTNGNYLVFSTLWDNGAAADAGAVTWGNMNTGVVGAVSAANSIVGSQANDMVGWEDWGEEVILPNGNYALHSVYWDNGAAADAGAFTIIDGTNGTFGTINASNSILGAGAGGMWSYNYEENYNALTGRYVVGDSAAQRIYSVDINTGGLSAFDSFTDSTGSDVTLSPGFITQTLNAGTAVTLQASNDITLNNDLTVNNTSGDGGDLTLQAGRSILLNADIFTDNGDLNLFANEDLATGVVNAQRDVGAAVITMGAGSQIDAGSGAVTIRLDDGTGKTNHAGGDITLRDISAGTVLVQNKNTTGDVVLQSGTVQASGAGDALTIVSSRDFINNGGVGALSTPSGRWLIYSTDPASDTLGGLTANFRRFSCTFGGSCPTLGAGNGFLYSTTPMLVITPDALPAITYGDATPSLAGYSYSVSGYLGGDAADDTLSGSLDGLTAYTLGSNAGSYGISYNSGTLTSDLGYGFTYANNASGITVGKRDLTASFASSLTKTYGNANPTLTYANFNFTGLVGADSASLFSSIVGNYGAVDANSDVGTYAISATISPTTNYTVSVDPSSTLQILSRSLSVLTHSKSKTLPAADPTFTGSNNLTAYDAGLISWTYAPSGYTGAAGAYTITASATDALNRLANYTRVNSYGTFTVNPAGSTGGGSGDTADLTDSSMPDTVKYMSLGGYLRDVQGSVELGETASTNSGGNSLAQNTASNDPLIAQLDEPLPAEGDNSAADTSHDADSIKLHPVLKYFLVNPFAMLVGNSNS